MLADTSNFTAQAQAFKAAGVTHLAVLGHQGDFFQFVEEARRQKFHPTYIGSDGWGRTTQVYEDLVKNHGDAQFIGYKTSYWSGKAETPFAKEFFIEAQKALKRQPNDYNAIGFDAAWLIFTAMNKVKNPNDSDQIRRELENLKNLPLTTAKSFTFGKSHSPSKDIHIYKITHIGVEYQERAAE